MQRNCALLVAVDSSKAEYRYVQEGFFSAFEHFGLPYRVWDLAKGRLTRRELDDTSGLVIAQEGMGAELSAAGDEVQQSVEATGVGLVNFDHRLDSYSPGLRRMLSGTGGEVSFRQSKGLKVAGNSHFITRPYDGKEKGEFLRSIEVTAGPSQGREGALVASLEGHPMLRACGRGRGRLVQFLVSPKMWHSEYFGHCCGFDGLFWRSVVWAARKPFAMMPMPPFVTAQIDDASGSASIFGVRPDSANRAFAYIDVLNRFGYTPHVGLYLDDITQSDSRILKEKHDKGLAQFAAHAFSDPQNINEHPICMRHDGTEFSVEEIEENFARVDERFARWGIRVARTANPHFAETGVRALPFLEERGARYVVSQGVPFGYNWAGAAEGKHPEWNPRPYGDHGFNYDSMPDHPEFFNVVSLPLGAHKLKDGSVEFTDFLWGKTRFWDESRYNRIEEAGEKGAGIVRLGLDGGFFGCLMSHEQRVATLSTAEWEEIVGLTIKLTARYERRFALYDDIAEYAKSKYDTKILEASHNGASGQVTLRVAGQATVPLQVRVFAGETPECQIREMPAFAGQQEIRLS